MIIGSAGTAGLGYEEAFKVLSINNIKALEIEFTHGIHLNDQSAKQLRALADSYNIKLSIHAPYFINLASLDEKKIINSINFIVRSCYFAHLLNAKPVVFHAGYYLKRDPQLVYEIIKENITKIIEILRERSINCTLAPETTGKPTQFGSLEELLKLKAELGIDLCIDFAHIKARSNGSIDIRDIIDKIPDNFHAHFSGIVYNEKGERYHIPIDDVETRELFKTLIKAKRTGRIIIESPNPIEDSIKAQKILETLDS